MDNCVKKAIFSVRLIVLVISNDACESSNSERLNAKRTRKLR